MCDKKPQEIQLTQFFKVQQLFFFFIIQTIISVPKDLFYCKVVFEEDILFTIFE